MDYLIKYQKRQLFKRGISVSISLLYKCTLNCSYCSLKNFGTKTPHDTLIYKANEWLNYIDTFPVKIKEIFLTGGEPGIYPLIDHLTNQLIKRGYFITIFTNLTSIASFMRIESSPNLKFQATYHKDMDLEIFKTNYKIMNEFFRVDVDEIETNYFGGSNVKKLCTIETEKKTDRLRIDSDMKIYTNCYDRNLSHL